MPLYEILDSNNRYTKNHQGSTKHRSFTAKIAKNLARASPATQPCSGPNNDEGSTASEAASMQQLIERAKNIRAQTHAELGQEQRKDQRKGQRSFDPSQLRAGGCLFQEGLTL